MVELSLAVVIAMHPIGERVFQEVGPACTKRGVNMCTV